MTGSVNGTPGCTEAGGLISRLRLNACVAVIFVVSLSMLVVCFNGMEGVMNISSSASPRFSEGVMNQSGVTGTVEAANLEFQFPRWEDRSN